MAKVFIVEDEIKIQNELMTFLSKNGFTCETTNCFEHLPQQIIQSNSQLVLLDINIPIGDGFDVCHELRKNSNIPIIVVTSRDTDIDELISMQLGADDFITKPFHTQILLARITSVLRRCYPQEAASCISYQNLTLHLSKATVNYQEQEIELSKNELRILHALLEKSGEIISRNELMDILWQSDSFVDDNTLTVNINRLRKKLERIGLNDLIKTKRGMGYII